MRTPQIVLLTLLLTSFRLLADTPATPPTCVLGKNLEAPVDETAIESFFNQAAVKKAEDPIDALICCLPENFRTNPPYVHTTRSNQDASFEKPRALLTDGQTVLSFSGLSDNVEIIAPKGEQYQTRLKFSRFAPSKHGAGVNDSSSCFGCHHGRPNWDTYGIWPGLYAGQEDQIPDGSVEASKWEAFIKARPSLPRYRCLKENGGYQNKDFTIRNFEFGKSLFYLNLVRVSSQLDQSKAVEPYRAALLSLAYCKTSLKDLVPSQVLARVPISEREAAQKKRLEEELKTYLREKFTRLKEIRDGKDSLSLNILRDEVIALEHEKLPLTAEKDPSLAEWRALLQGVAKLDLMDDWSIIPFEHYLFFNAGESPFIGNLADSLIGKWGPGLGYQGNITPEFCQGLKTKSLASIPMTAASGEPRVPEKVTPRGPAH